jgi:hypothetical protein
LFFSCEKRESEDCEVTGYMYREEGKWVITSLPPGSKYSEGPNYHYVKDYAVTLQPGDVTMVYACGECYWKKHGVELSTAPRDIYIKDLVFLDEGDMIIKDLTATIYYDDDADLWSIRREYGDEPGKVDVYRIRNMRSVLIYSISSSSYTLGEHTVNGSCFRINPKHSVQKGYTYYDMYLTGSKPVLHNGAP